MNTGDVGVKTVNNGIEGGKTVNYRREADEIAANGRGRGDEK